MKMFLRHLADVLDGLTALAAICAIWFLVDALPTAETGPALVQVLLYALTAAAIPYCLAGAVHRVWRRFP